jgi:hypothetical protein
VLALLQNKHDRASAKVAGVGCEWIKNIHSSDFVVCAAKKARGMFGCGFQHTAEFALIFFFNDEAVPQTRKKKGGDSGKTRTDAPLIRKKKHSF